MPKLVHVPGAGNVEFPDDFTEDQITEALGKHFGAAKEEPVEKPKKVEPTVVGQDQVEFGPPPELSSEIAPLKRIGRGAMEAGGRLAQAIGMVSELGPMAPPGVYSPQIDEAWRVRMQRTLPQAIEDVRQHPIYQAGTVARQGPEELLPLTPAQKQSVIGGGLEAGAGMLGYVASGGQAPALIGAEAFTEHLVNDYEQLQNEGLSTDEAAGKAMDKALASGGIQAAIFTVLPPAFRKTADKYLVQKFGENALANFFARRAAMTGEVAGLMTTAGAAENVIAGQPITQGLGQTALGGGVLGLLTPYGQPQTATTTLPRTLKETARSIYASRIKKAAEVHGDMRPLAVESSREVPVEEGGARVQPQAQAGIPQEGQEGVLLERIEGQPITSIRSPQEPVILPGTFTRPTRARPVVPEIPPTPYETNVQEARRLGANTIPKILDLFPSLEGNRSRAREIRDAAFPKGSETPVKGKPAALTAEEQTAAQAQLAEELGYEKPGKPVARPAATTAEVLGKKAPAETAETSFKGIQAEETPVVTEVDVSKMSKSEQATLNHNRGIEYGVGLTDADVPRLEAGYKEAGKEMVKASLSKDNEGMKAAFGRLNFYGGALQGATRGTHTAAAGNYQRWVQERSLSGKQAEGFTYKGKPMSEADMRARLNQTHGVTEGSPVVFTDQGPLMNTIWEGRRNPDGSLAPSRPLRIEINRNEIYSQGQLDHFFNEELLHWYDIENKGKLDQVVSALTPQESKALDTLIDKIKKYPKEEQPWEKRAQGANQLAANWRNKSFFQKMVVEIQSFLSDTLGFKASEKVLRARAEKMAAQAIINAAERVRVSQKPAQAMPVPPKLAQPSPASEAPKAEVSIATEEPPHGVKLDVTTPAAHPLGPIATTTAPTLAWHQILTGELKEAGAGLRRFWRSFSMQSLPRITEADRRTGELGVRYDASRTVARVKGLEFAENVLAGIKAKGFDQQFGTALAEDNLRGIRRDFQDAAQRYRAEGKTEEADAALESAGKVTTLIGARNSPFASEAQYQAFLNAPEVQQAIRRHIQLWQEQKDPIYRKANDIDPDVVLETRGLQTGARINLKAVMPEEGTRTTVGAAGRSPLIRQAVTRLRKDPFARQAKGTGTSYEGSYREIMANGYEREFPVAAQHEFIKQMIDSGLAKVTVNREFPKGMLIRGETPKAFELKIGPWRNQWLQVPRSLAEEFQNVSGLTPGWNVPVVKPLSDMLTQASVQGFAEGSTHVSNLSTGILTNLGPTANPMLNALIKSAGRVDVLYTLPRILIRGFTATREEMLKLAEIGAAKTPYGGLMGWFINGIDRGVRLVSADVYDGMARKGWVKDTETGKREFINQVGQYSKRLQPTTIARLRETGVQPFATAMHTFNVQGLRTLGLGPGAKAPTALAALALRADKAAGIMGFIVLVTAINKLISGKATGPPGTQLGSVGWIGDDGKLRQFNLARAFGYERGFRTTGLQGFVEARRLGLPEATALGAGVRSIGQTGLGYVSGPATQFATKAVTGKRPGIPMVQEAKVVPPPATDELQPMKTQAAANIAIALQQANPAVDAALMAMQGKEVPDILQRQFSRYTPRAGMSQETIEAMPKIMAAKQMGDYVNYLAKEARKLPLGERNKFVRDRLWEDELTAQQRAQALQRLQVKGVFRYR